MTQAFSLPIRSYSELLKAKLLFYCYGIAMVTEAHLLDLSLSLHEDKLPLPGEGSLKPGQVLLLDVNTSFQRLCTKR